MSFCFVGCSSRFVFVLFVFAFVAAFGGYLRVFWRVFVGVLLQSECCATLWLCAAKRVTKTTISEKKDPFEVPGGFKV